MPLRNLLIYRYPFSLFAIFFLKFLCWRQHLICPLEFFKLEFFGLYSISNHYGTNILLTCSTVVSLIPWVSIYQICFGLCSGLCVFKKDLPWFLFWEGPSVVGDVCHTSGLLQPSMRCTKMFYAVSFSLALSLFRHFKFSRLETIPPTLLPSTQHGIGLGTVRINKILTEEVTYTCVWETTHSSLVIWWAFS